MAARIIVRKPVVEGVETGDSRVIDVTTADRGDEMAPIWSENCQIEIRVVVDRAAAAPRTAWRRLALPCAALTIVAFSAGLGAGSLLMRPSNTQPAGGTAIAEFNPKQGTVMDCCYEGWAGMAFLVGEEPITVTELGRWMVPNNRQSHVLRIINAGTQVPLAGASTSLQLAGRNPNRFHYASLPAPVMLEANTTYYIVSSERVVPNEPNQDYFYGHDAVIRANGAIRVRKPVFWNKGRWEEIDSAGTTYGPLDFKYAPAATRP